jgi:phosphoglycolate phosphatase
VAEVVAALARRRPLAVATAKPVEFAGPILERLGLAGLFRAVAGPPLAAPAGEPKARIVARALEALGLSDGAKAALVGDRHHDVEAGRALGLATVGVLWGSGSAQELSAAGAGFLARTPSDLLALFGEEL